jgi:4-hydroxy-4-methyl-2-oxoglutarate aldolase
MVSTFANDAAAARLSVLDTCVVSDALDRAGIRGVALGIIALSTVKRITGRAVTVQLATDDGRSRKRHLCTAAVEAAGPESIIVVAHQGRTDVAGWGGILSLSASIKGVAGAIIDGACRDLDESRELNFPVYGRCAVPITARGRVIEVGWNEAIEIAGISVKSRDLIIADASGVVVIPQEHAESVLGVAESLALKERLMAEALRRGDAVSSVMGAKYETMLSNTEDQ